MNAEEIGKLCDIQPDEDTSWMGTPEENKTMTGIAAELIDHMVEYLVETFYDDVARAVNVPEKAVDRAWSMLVWSKE